MPYLIESIEWRLIRELGRSFGQRKAGHRIKPLGCHGPVHPTVEHIEVELRRLFIHQDIPQSVNDVEFGACQVALRKLCLRLEDLVSEQLIARSSKVGASSYPRLRALLPFLDSVAQTFNLVHGPDTALFVLPNSVDELYDCLDIATECSRALSKLLAPPASEPIPQPPRKQKAKNKDAWKKARVRKQATFALETLFKHFKCGTAHEVLLRLTEDTDQDAALPTLRMMLSRCPDLESWLEARCESLNLTESSILPIPDMRTVLPKCLNHGAALVLYMEKYALFGAWEESKFPAVESRRESLGQLLAKGVFEPPSRDISAVLEGLTPCRFSTREKQALAVKLGFCLMDFFDAEVDSNRIYFLESSRKESPPYLAFKSRLPATPNPYNFRKGHPHPILLSFAKLLLEIYCGQAIDLDIGSDDRQIRDSWTKLLDVVETLERDRQDSQLQAISGCLLVHQDIAKALGSGNIDTKDAEKKIRRKLYKNVVCKLQQGLAESTPRKKRRRSESPHAATEYDRTKTMSPSDSPPRFMGPDFTLPQRKRHRAPDFMNSLSSDTRGGNPLLTEANVSPPTSRDDFEVAIVCALPVEYNAVSLLVDEFWDEHSGASSARGDTNRYKTGRIGRVNVVLVLLSNMGKASAASSTTSLAMSYLGLKLVLLIGICGGVPQTRAGQEMLLGDVVISNSVIQYDLGRRFPDKFAMRDAPADMLGRPDKNIRNLVAILGTDLERQGVEERTALFLKQLQQKSSNYQYPGASQDRLFKASFRHGHHSAASLDDVCLCNTTQTTCEESRGLSCKMLGCLDNDENLVTRKRIKTKQLMERAGRPDDAQAPSIFVGPFGSGDTVLKSAKDRDDIAGTYGILAYEMEAAGVWETMPCIVVKGVCDYADSHKNKAWQAFASAAASSAARALLERYIQDNVF
ncbi:unnamed protein product [Clonostachys byssicola]|uniref:Nucleoside phosphorylase domain-containing protein n=1 Tax=Clonostachys byssicola TaxID=160290 RepID=A0A9N9U9H4_9HYPO|nr:unnamed protein product [Clonostachys byssicola]